MRWIPRILVGLWAGVVIGVITYKISYNPIDFLITEITGSGMLSFPEAICCSSSYMFIAGLAVFIVVSRLLGERNRVNTNEAIGLFVGYIVAVLTFIIGFASVDFFVQFIPYDDSKSDIVNEIVAQRGVIDYILIIVPIAGVIAGFATVWLLGKRESGEDNT